MNKPLPLDVRGNLLAVGDFVCYTTNSRGSGLNFGHIDAINEKNTQRYDWEGPLDNRVRITTPWIEYKIVVAVTDVDGNPKFLEEFDRNTRTWIANGRRRKTGQLEYSASKFMKI